MMLSLDWYGISSLGRIMNAVDGVWRQLCRNPFQLQVCHLGLVAPSTSRRVAHWLPHLCWRCKPKPTASQLLTATLLAFLVSIHLNGLNFNQSAILSQVTDLLFSWTRGPFGCLAPTDAKASCTFWLLWHHWTECSQVPLGSLVLRSDDFFGLFVLSTHKHFGLSFRHHH